MKLCEFLSETGMKPSHFCNKVGISSTTLYNILSGDTAPNLRTAISIYNFTNKQVRYEDMLNDNVHHKIKKRNTKKKEKEEQPAE
jgi:DNA-binding XRE family transcriptional regulator